MLVSLHPAAAPRLPFPPPAATAPPRHEVRLTPAAVAQFDALLHEVNPDARRADPTRVERLASWFSTLRPEDADALVRQQLERVGELGAMLADEDWATDESTCVRAHKMLEYIDRDDDLIDDRGPLGLLDDALFVDLAWPAFAAEVEEYLDFCEFRRDHRLDGVDPAHRDAWRRTRLDEIDAWRRAVQRSQAHYLRYWPPDELFHVR